MRGNNANQNSRPAALDAGEKQMNKYKNTETLDANAPIKVDSVTIEWINERSPDLSWLDQTDAEMGEGFEAQSKQRKDSYGNTWEMLGCVAKAVVSRPIGQGSRRLETLTSGGLWGIESDSSKEYLAELENEQLAELAEHLNAFGIEATAESLRKELR